MNALTEATTLSSQNTTNRMMHLTCVIYLIHFFTHFAAIFAAILLYCPCVYLSFCRSFHGRTFGRHFNYSRLNLPITVRRQYSGFIILEQYTTLHILRCILLTNNNASFHKLKLKWQRFTTRCTLWTLVYPTAVIDT